MKTRTNKSDDEFVSNWQEGVEDHFFLGKFAESWFKIAEWVIITGAFGYLDKVTESFWVNLVYLISYAMLFNFSQLHIYSSKSFNSLLPSRLSKRNRGIISYVLATVIVVIVLVAVTSVLNELGENPL